MVTLLFRVIFYLIAPKDIMSSSMKVKIKCNETIAAIVTFIITHNDSQNIQILVGRTNEPL